MTSQSYKCTSYLLLTIGGRCLKHKFDDQLKVSLLKMIKIYFYSINYE